MNSDNGQSINQSINQSVSQSIGAEEKARRTWDGIRPKGLLDIIDSIHLVV